MNGESLQMCATYNSDKFYSFMLGNGITFLTVIINTLLRELIIYLTLWVGHDTRSEQLTSITSGVFLTQFFNTGLLLLLVNANLTEYGENRIIKSFNGPFSDYTPDWYNDVGYKTL